MLNQSVSQEQYREQLPNNVREALIGTDASKTALLLDLLLLLGYKPGQRVTAREVIAVTKEHTSQNIAREGLLHTSIKRIKLPSMGRGRPTYAYVLPSMEKLLNELTGGLRSPSDPISIEDCKSISSYKKALHRELIARGCADSVTSLCYFSRMYMARRLNISEQTLRNYEKELETYVKPNWGYEAIPSKAYLYQIPLVRQHDGTCLRCENADGKVVRLPSERKLAGYYLKLGWKVEIEKRLVNGYAPEDPGNRYSSGKWADFIES